MAMPLLTHDGEPVGAMLLVNKRGGGGGFGADDEVALARLATEAAVTLRHATQIHARYTHASAIYSQIFGIAGQLQRSARAALALVGVEVQLRVPCMQLAVLQLAPEGSGRALRAAYATEQLALSEETYDFALRARRPINTAKDQPRGEGWPLDLYSAPSTLLVPFCSVNGAPLGMLQLVDRQGAPYFDDADVALVPVCRGMRPRRLAPPRGRRRSASASASAGPGAAPAAGGGTGRPDAVRRARVSACRPESPLSGFSRIDMQLRILCLRRESRAACWLPNRRRACHQCVPCTLQREAKGTSTFVLYVYSEHKNWILLKS